MKPGRGRLAPATGMDVIGKLESQARIAPSQAQPAFSRRILLPLMAIILAAVIFAVDTFSPLGLAVAVLYVLVIVMCVGFCGQRGLVVVASGCGLLTLVSFLMDHGRDLDPSAAIRCLVSLFAILITTILAQRSQAAAAVLQKSERRYRGIFEATGTSIWEDDFSRVKQALDKLHAQGVVDFPAYLAAHPAFVSEAFELVRPIDINRATLKLVRAETKAQVFAARREILGETMAVGAMLLEAIFEGRRSLETETVLLALDGERLSVLLAFACHADDVAFERVLISLSDVTAHRRAEHALHEAQAAASHVGRLTTLGEMTASIGHEVNQPLAAIVANGQAACLYLSRPEPNVAQARQAIGFIVEDAGRATEVVQRLRKLSKKGRRQSQPVDLNGLIGETAAIMRRQAESQGVDLRLELADGLPTACGDPIELQQVLINLVVNAIHAMEVVALDDRILIMRSFEDEGGLTITVSDTGAGLEPEVTGSLFEAFVSTKPDGMGMGLAICRSIVTAHDGRISAQDNVGPGATFRIVLPPGGGTPKTAKT